MIANLAFSLVAKGLQAIMGFAVIHHLIALWGPARYGAWVTMTSLIAYTSMFDFGVGYGIKNKITETHTTARLVGAEVHIRFGVLFYTGSAIILLVGGLLYMPTASPFRDSLNAAIVLWVGFSISFLLSYANIILQALGKFKLINAISLIAPGGWLAFIVFSTATPPVSPTAAAAVFAGLLIGQNLILSVLAINAINIRISGSLAEALRLAPQLLKTGAKFFALQLSALVLFYSGNLFTFHFLGPVEVARFDAASKVFSVFSIGFSILISIAWTEVSKAKASKDGWRLTRIFMFLHVSAVILGVMAMGVAWQSFSLVSRLTGVEVTPSEALPFALLATVQALAFSSAVFLNAFERLNGQVFLAALAIPLFFYCAYAGLHYGGGIGSVPLAAVAATLPAGVYCFVVALRIIGKVERMASARQS